MSSEIELMFKGSQKVRVSTEADGKPWWLGVDVCRVLGYASPKDAIRAHCRQKGAVIRSTLTSGGAQDMIWIDEGNLVRLITRSKLPAAEEFESWIFDEVIPRVLRTGTYTVGVDLRRDAPPALTLEQVRDVVRAELAAHAPGVPLSTHRVYLMDTLAQYAPTASRGLKDRFRQLVKLLADEHGRAIYRQDGTRDGRLYMLPEDAHILHRAWVWMQKGWGGGRRMLPGFGAEVASQSKNP